MKPALLDALQERVLLLDGAMGTMLQRADIIAGCPEELNLTRPGIVKEVHAAYAAAGADAVLTNTFGASRIKLDKYGLGGQVVAINRAAVVNARAAAPACFVIGDVGPLGELLEPLGALTFDAAYAAFREQVEALAGVDALIIETISDIRELKAALLAAKDAFSGPVISSMTIQDGRSTGGTDAVTYAVIADALGAAVIGLNCSDGPEGLYETAKLLVRSTGKPVCLQPNAGLPRMVDGQPVWEYPVRRFAEYAEKYRRLGVSLIGGCCGTTPEYIGAARELLAGKSLVAREAPRGTRLCSATRTVLVAPTVVVGERINPTNRKGFAEELRRGETRYVRDQALQQVAEGARLLDLNVGLPGLGEAALLVKVVRAVEQVVDVPLVLDSSDPVALESALRACAGKPLINSVNGSSKSLAAVLPLAKRYGAAVIGLCLDDDGIPSTAEGRVAVALRILAAAERAGLSRADVIFDPLVMTVAVDPTSERVTLDALARLKGLGLTTVLGVSNISHGLPGRSALNARFYTKAHQAGLDLALMNPLDTILCEETSLAVAAPLVKRVDYGRLSLAEKLRGAILYGDQEVIVSLVEEALGSMDALALNALLVSALEEVGRRFNAKEYYLPQVLLSAQAMKVAFGRLKREFEKQEAVLGGGSPGTVLFATVENDIHDIGKNIVIALLESHRYRVIDLGFNVKREKIIAAVERERPDVVALSALMTTTAPEMERIVVELRRRGDAVPVIVGGAVVTGDYAAQIRAGYAKDALSAVKKIEELISSKDR